MRKISEEFEYILKDYPELKKGVLYLEEQIAAFAKEMNSPVQIEASPKNEQSFSQYQDLSLGLFREASADEGLRRQFVRAREDAGIGEAREISGKKSKTKSEDGFGIDKEEESSSNQKLSIENSM